MVLRRDLKGGSMFLFVRLRFRGAQWQTVVWCVLFGLGILTGLGSVFGDSIIRQIISPAVLAMVVCASSLYAISSGYNQQGIILGSISGLLVLIMLYQGIVRTLLLFL